MASVTEAGKAPYNCKADGTSTWKLGKFEANATEASAKLTATSPYSHDGSVKEGAIDGTKKYKFMIMGFAT